MISYFIPDVTHRQPGKRRHKRGIKVPFAFTFVLVCPLAGRKIILLEYN